MMRIFRQRVKQIFSLYIRRMPSRLQNHRPLFLGNLNLSYCQLVQVTKSSLAVPRRLVCKLFTLHLSFPEISKLHGCDHSLKRVHINCMFMINGTLISYVIYFRSAALGHSVNTVNTQAGKFFNRIGDLIQGSMGCVINGTLFAP